MQRSVVEAEHLHAELLKMRVDAIDRPPMVGTGSDQRLEQPARALVVRGITVCWHSMKANHRACMKHHAGNERRRESHVTVNLAGDVG